MAINGTIDLDFGDAKYTFCISKLKQIFELQDKCDAGPAQILERLTVGTWRVNDLREVIRLGLIGGGATPVDALRIVRDYVDERPWAESIAIARTILLVAIVGIPEDPVGKPVAERAASEATDALSAPKSTAPAPRSASRRGRSTKSPSGNSPRASTDTIKRTAEKKKSARRQMPNSTTC